MAVGFAVLSFLGISSLFVLLTLIFCAIVLLHDLRKKYSHIPGPRVDSFIWGNCKIFETEKSKSLLFEELFRQYGPVIVTWHIYKPLVSVQNQDVIQGVLEPSSFKDCISNDDFWDIFEQRFIARGAMLVYGDSAFNDNSIRRHLKNFDSCTDKFITMLGTKTGVQTEVKMAEQFSKLSVDVIAKVAFGINLNCMQDPDVPFYKALRECQNAITWSIAHPFHKWDVSTYDYQNDLIEAVKYLRDFGKKVIDRRRTNMRNGEFIEEDYLTWMLATGDRDDSISLGDMLDEFLCVFISGQGQLTGLLSSMLLELLRHPVIEEKMYEEVINTVTNNSPVTFEHLSQLKFTSCVIKETLRLHPPVSTVMSKLRRRGRLAGYLIQEKTLVQMIPYVIQTSPKRWQQPKVFTPERFVDVEDVRLSTLFPFAMRKHTYLNDSFVDCLAKVVFPSLLQKLKFVFKNDQDVSPSGDLFSAPKDGVVCTLSTI